MSAGVGGRPQVSGSSGVAAVEVGSVPSTLLSALFNYLFINFKTCFTATFLALGFGTQNKSRIVSIQCKTADCDSFV